MTQKLRLDLTPEEAALVHKALQPMIADLDIGRMAIIIRTKIRVAECDPFVAAARQRDLALPADHTRGRSKLFKS